MFRDVIDTSRVSCFLTHSVHNTKTNRELFILINNS